MPRDRHSVSNEEKHGEIKKISKGEQIRAPFDTKGP